jgi:hypothetical protein
MPSAIVELKDGYGLDIWGNYLKVDAQKSDNKWYFSSILIIHDENEIKKAKKALNNA